MSKGLRSKRFEGFEGFEGFESTLSLDLLPLVLSPLTFDLSP